MTMLDRMRRHRTWLKWSLVFVCATFVLLYVPQFLDPTGTGAGVGARTQLPRSRAGASPRARTSRCTRSSSPSSDRRTGR